MLFEQFTEPCFGCFQRCHGRVCLRNRAQPIGYSEQCHRVASELRLRGSRPLTLPRNPVEKCACRVLTERLVRLMRETVSRFRQRRVPTKSCRCQTVINRCFRIERTSIYSAVFPAKHTCDKALHLLWC